MNKKAQIDFTPGMIFRLTGGFIEVLSLPFIIVAPTNTIAWIFFSFGAGLLAVGGTIN